LSKVPLDGKFSGLLGIQRVVNESKGESGELGEYLKPKLVRGEKRIRSIAKTKAGPD